MEGLMTQASQDAIHLGSRAVAICARFARHTAHNAALVYTWQMFRGVAPRSRSPTLYAEMMVPSFSCLSSPPPPSLVPLLVASLKDLPETPSFRSVTFCF
jgi:hypothetical protein